MSTRIKILVISAVLYVLCIPSVYPQSMQVTNSAYPVHSGLNELRYSDGQRYFLYIPELVLSRPEEAHILAAIHGYSGRMDNAEGIRIVERTALRWASVADEYGWVVLAPHFDEDRFNDDYQRLNISVLGLGVRSDLRLNELIDETRRLIPGINSHKIYIFGFSGGGQFVHRYTAFHPERIQRAVSGGSGWYMWPDDDLLYPVGTLMWLRGAEPDIPGLLESNLLVLVGDEDMTDYAFRESYGLYDLMEIQGETRLERAENWVNELEKEAERGNIDLNVELKLAEATGHSISYNLKRMATDYLTEDIIPITVRLWPWDVDRNGAVGISDLIIVSDYLGARVGNLEPDPDVNNDGLVNVLDVVLVAMHFGESYSSSAPPALSNNVDPEHLIRIEKIHRIVADNADGNPDFLHAEGVLSSIINPIQAEKLLVFQNYPNPFNPETWIPYQLAEDSDVTINIYSTTGQKIRELAPGHKAAGLYIAKRSAAYWDGMTETGERAPSGVYFYSVETKSGYSQPAKMTLLK